MKIPFLDSRPETSSQTFALPREDMQTLSFAIIAEAKQGASRRQRRSFENLHRRIFDQTLSQPRLYPSQDPTHDKINIVLTEHDLQLTDQAILTALELARQTAEQESRLTGYPAEAMRVSGILKGMRSGPEQVAHDLPQALQTLQEHLGFTEQQADS